MGIFSNSHTNSAGFDVLTGPKRNGSSNFLAPATTQCEPPVRFSVSDSVRTGYLAMGLQVACIVIPAQAAFVPARTRIMPPDAALTQVAQSSPPLLPGLEVGQAAGLLVESLSFEGDSPETQADGSSNPLISCLMSIKLVVIRCAHPEG
jgi:hypothetical protein